MSDVSNDFPVADDDLGQIGETSENEIVQDEPQELPWYNLNLFNAMLLISFVLITVSAMLMLWTLTTEYGSIIEGPWNV
jgi:hypothetical protein